MADPREQRLGFPQHSHRGTLGDILAGIFTWDWARVWDGLVGIVDGLVGGFFGLVRVLLLGDTIDFIREEINKNRLRNYVRGLLEVRFADDPTSLDAAKDAIGES